MHSPTKGRATSMIAGIWLKMENWEGDCTYVSNILTLLVCLLKWILPDVFCSHCVGAFLLIFLRYPRWSMGWNLLIQHWRIDLWIGKCLTWSAAEYFIKTCNQTTFNVWRASRVSHGGKATARMHRTLAINVPPPRKKKQHETTVLHWSSGSGAWVKILDHIDNLRLNTFAESSCWTTKSGIRISKSRLWKATRNQKHPRARCCRLRHGTEAFKISQWSGDFQERLVTCSSKIRFSTTKSSLVFGIFCWNALKGMPTPCILKCVENLVLQTFPPFSPKTICQARCSLGSALALWALPRRSWDVWSTARGPSAAPWRLPWIF